MSESSPRRSRARSASISVRDALVAFVKDRFDLRDDQAYEGETMEAVRRDVQFRGANLWILLFAILICSIGLNVNSPAVVIGAMLISPLMGPILGIGVGVAVYDFDLLLTAIKNLAIATAASVFVSSVYFGLSPITEAQSELLARVSPTLWDVLVATFGGFAGIIAVSRREKGNALPGVAIATALMPPICTAGYAIAQNKWDYFFGSLYLFFINIVFIAVSTFVLARFMRFTKQQFVDADQERRVRRWIMTIVAAVAIPSVYTAYNTVERSIYLQRATQFVEQQCDFQGAEVVSRRITGSKDNSERTIELVLIGKPISQAAIDSSVQQMADYGLTGVSLVVLQDRDEYAPTPAQIAMLQRMQSGERIYAGRQSASVQPQLDKPIGISTGWLKNTSSDSTLLAEAKVIAPDIDLLGFAPMASLPLPSDSLQVTSLSLKEAVIRIASSGDVDPQQLSMLQRWLTARMNADTIYVLK